MTIIHQATTAPTGDEGTAPPKQGPASGVPVATKAPDVAAAAPAAPAAAAAPVIDPLPAAPFKEAAADPGPEVVGVVEYEKTGRVGLDLALDFVGKLGYGPKHPAMVAAAEGNFALMKAELASKGVKGAAEFMALAEQDLASQKAATEQRRKADAEAILKVAGGEAEWKATREWITSKAEPDELKQVQETMNAGGIAARALAAYLTGLRRQAPGQIVNPADVTVAKGAPSSGNGALSPSEYKAAIADLKAKTGGNLEGSKEYADLQARRKAYRK